MDGWTRFAHLTWPGPLAARRLPEGLGDSLSRAQLLKAIHGDRLAFPVEEWENVSESAKDCVRLLLTVEAADRPTVRSQHDPCPIRCGLPRHPVTVEQLAGRGRPTLLSSRSPGSVSWLPHAQVRQILRHPWLYDGESNAPLASPAVLRQSDGTIVLPQFQRKRSKTASQLQLDLFQRRIREVRRGPARDSRDHVPSNVGLHGHHDGRCRSSSLPAETGAVCRASYWPTSPRHR